MKEATGELNMTVIVVIAIAAVAALFYAFIWPSIQNGLKLNTCNSMCGVSKDTDSDKSATVDGDTCTCPNGQTIDMSEEEE